MSAGALAWRLQQSALSRCAAGVIGRTRIPIEAEWPHTLRWFATAADDDAAQTTSWWWRKFGMPPAPFCFIHGVVAWATTGETHGRHDRNDGAQRHGSDSDASGHGALIAATASQSCRAPTSVSGSACHDVERSKNSSPPTRRRPVVSLQAAFQRRGTRDRALDAAALPVCVVELFELVLDQPCHPS